jgi:hypothetical protein
VNRGEGGRNCGGLSGDLTLLHLDLTRELAVGWDQPDVGEYALSLETIPSRRAQEPQDETAHDLTESA